MSNDFNGFKRWGVAFAIEHLCETAASCAMFYQSCTKLQDLPMEQVKDWLGSFDTVISDCDGVLWLGDRPFELGAQTISALQAYGKQVYICTNDATKTRQQYHAKAEALGFNICEQEIIAAGHATAAYLKQHLKQPKVYLIGSAGLAQELAAVGIAHTPVGPDPMPACSLTQYFDGQLQLEPNVGGVVVSLDAHFSYPKLAKATGYLRDANCLFVATNPDARYPSGEMVRPDVGCMVRAVETAACREALVVGKPNASMCQELLDKQLIEPQRTLIIGDTCTTDILLGYNCGFQTMLVGTGNHHLADVALWQQSNDPDLKNRVPDVYLPRFADLLRYL